jgi:hypothetical protein
MKINEIKLESELKNHKMYTIKRNVLICLLLSGTISLCIFLIYNFFS